MPKAKRGFTLLETLVAVLILTFALVAPMSIVSKTLFASTVASQEVTAVYLAQEAMEGVREIRDQNYLSGQAWLTGLTVGSDFRIDVVNPDASNKPTITVCGGACPAINYDSSSHLYQYSTGSASAFTRTTRITTINANEVTVTTTVAWNIGTITRTFTVRTNLFNWQ